MKSYQLEALAPWLFGYGMPFGTSPGALSALSLELPRPATLAGAVRTSLARENDLSLLDQPSLIRQVAIRGPILLRNGEPVFAAPADAAHVTIDREEFDVPAFPDPAWRDFVSAPVDAPDSWAPTRLVGDLEQYIPSKEKRSAWWSQEAMVNWLTSHQPVSPEGGLGSPAKETRTHVSLEARRAREGMLFTTQGVCIADHIRGDEVDAWRILVALHDERTIEPILTLGGERRLARAQECSTNVWMCPEEIRTALKGTKHVRLVLATPCVFAKGWQPGWTELHGVGLKLCGAAMPRRQAWAGWDMEKDGLKPLRYGVAAGSTYFFEVTSGDASALADHWLTSVADDEQDQRDGAGLALWGTWAPHEVQS